MKILNCQKVFDVYSSRSCSISQHNKTLSFFFFTSSPCIMVLQLQNYLYNGSTVAKLLVQWFYSYKTTCIMVLQLQNYLTFCLRGGEVYDDHNHLVPCCKNQPAHFSAHKERDKRLWIVLTETPSYCGEQFQQLK